MNIFELMQSKELGAYWSVLAQGEAPYACEELFPSKKKMGLDLKWLKGSKGLPVVLKVSAFDAHAIPRPRIGLAKVTAEMPYFKESKYIDEEMRQSLNLVLATGNQEYIDSIVTRIFDDQMELIRGARVARERMRMQALTTGLVSMKCNGQALDYDYGISHKKTVGVSWSNRASAKPIEDIRALQEEIYRETGSRPTRAMCDLATWNNIKNNEEVKKSIYVLTQGEGYVNDKKLEDFLFDELKIKVYVNESMYRDENGQELKFMPADTFVMFPEGALGNTWFGTTPAESDLMNHVGSDVSIVDNGVAINIIKHDDPVNTETIISQISLPSFEQADKVGIIDTTAE